MLDVEPSGLQSQFGVARRKLQRGREILEGLIEAFLPDLDISYEQEPKDFLTTGRAHPGLQVRLKIAKQISLFELLIKRSQHRDRVRIVIGVRQWISERYPPRRLTGR